MLSSLTDGDFRFIKKLVAEEIGVNLTDGKRSMVVSRLSRRLRDLNLADFSAYTAYIKQNPGELPILANLITTNVTTFFREEHHFSYLKATILPHLVEEARQGRRPPRVKIWSAGCSTGEEPYTLAMVMEEFVAANRGWDYRILASDINTQVLDLAKAGIYGVRQVKPIPYRLLTKYFYLGTEENKGFFKVKEALQRRLEFRVINLIKETAYPPGRDWDLILCRNVFIYFTRQTQEEILGRYWFRLRPQGHLFLGHSETIDTAPERGGRKWRLMGNTIYQRL